MNSARWARGLVLFLATIIGWSFAASAQAGNCAVTCSATYTENGQRGSITFPPYSYAVATRSACTGACSDICSRLPQLTGRPITTGASPTCVTAVFTPGAGESADGAPRVELPPVRPGSCTFVCREGSFSRTARVNEPEQIRTRQDCEQRCQTACQDIRSPLGQSYTCSSGDVQFEPLPADPSSNAAPPEEQEVEVSGGSRRSSNTTGARAAGAAAPALSAQSSCASFQGVNDPFCGKSFTEIIGGVVKFLLGVAGALFLAMFVYGGATWLTAGSSDRHEEARKTLVNAFIGILIVILSYTLVAGLVRLLGDFGVSQGDTQARFEAQPTGDTQSTPGIDSPNSSGAQTGTPAAGACNAQSFIRACHQECATSALVSAGDALGGGGSLRAQCDQACDGYGPRICEAVRSPSDCSNACDTLCSTAADLETICREECPGLCAAAFRPPTNE